MNHRELVDWLFENGGPTIRYRTATELMQPSGKVATGQLREELHQSELVKVWLERFVPSSLFNDLHGGKETAFENVIGKLTQLGCRKSMPEFDQRIVPYCGWLKDNAEHPPGHIFEVFYRTLIAAFMALAGYIHEPAVGTVLRNRLETVYDFTRQGRYDIYVSQASHPRVPSVWRGVPLINPVLSRDGNLCLPWIYDIVGLAAYLPECGTEDDWAKANTITNYILNEQYQRLPQGYGILLAENHRYYAMGWSVHLPGFLSDASEGSTVREFIQRLILMAKFPAAVQHPWFTNSRRHLSRFRTECGTYLFPRSYLQDDRIGYWVAGRRMGLEENRRPALAIELESTFWMATLQSMASAGAETAE